MYETDGASAFFCFCNEYAISALQLYYTKFGFKVAIAKENESLRSQLVDRMREIADLKNTVQAINANYAKLNRMRKAIRPSCRKPRRTGFIAEYFCPTCGTTTPHRVMGTSPYRRVRTCITCGLTI